jgi:aldose 1-epimerase
MKCPILFQNQPAVELTDTANRIVVSPDHGARILLWQHEGRDVITWPADADWSQLLKVRGGNPVLFPFPGRHFVEGKKELWRDANGTIRSMPQHGFARDAKFTVIDDPAENTLRMRLTATEATRAFYPFAFQFDVVVSLLPQSRLEIRFETTNPGAAPLPYYAGHHFYLALPHGERADWTLHVPCAEWGRQNPDGSIVHKKAAATDLRLDDESIIDQFQIGPRESTLTLLNSVNQRRLIFELAQPGSVPWHEIVTWTQAADSDFYCIEPWLGLPNAIHHGEGLRQVAPGQTEIAACVLDASGW